MRRSEIRKDTLLTKFVKNWHEEFMHALNKFGVRTLKRTAGQLHVFCLENRKYKDVEFIDTMVKILEFVIQKRSGEDWSIEKTKYDGRYLPYHRKDTVFPMDPELNKSLKEQAIDSGLDRVRHRHHYYGEGNKRHHED